ncbi:sulfatase [Compostibacter hankyongensis]|uniref:Sulfatase n=1 Tax=Compostibacter hankyongensis TaxID=1007089 RepID=A0ABP8FC69_9BACT
MRTFFYRATGLLGLLTLPLLLPAQQKTSAPPNIILILTDDLGGKDLSCYGSTFNETPNLDRMAAEGARFTDAYAACNVCSPSRSSIMTGQYPVHTGITDWIAGRQNGNGPMPFDRLLPRPFSFNLDTAQVTIAEALKQHGYATFFAGKWHLGLSPEYWPEHQGFDVNKGGWAAGNPRAHGMGGYFSPYHNPRLSDGPKGEFLPDRLTSEAIAFIRQKSAEHKPFFVELSFYAVHQPIEAKPAYIQKFKEKARRLGLDSLPQIVKDAPWMQWQDSWSERILQSNPVYAGLLYSVDENVGKVLAVLKQLDIDRETLVLFTSDNGGLSTAEGAPTSNAPFRYGKGWNYEGGLRVPLIIRWPARIKAGTVCRTPVIHTDFFPTFLQAATLPLMPEAHKDGISLMPLLTGNGPLAPRALYWHYPHYSNQGGTPSSAVREGDWKLVQFLEDNHVELYDLRSDVEERRDLSAAMPAQTAHLLELLNRWRKQTDARMPVLNPYYNPAAWMAMDKEERRKYLSGYHRLFDKSVFDPEHMQQVEKGLKDMSRTAGGNTTP